jgi:RNA polymerase sigma factor (sigma-70 family)
MVEIDRTLRIVLKQKGEADLLRMIVLESIDKVEKKNHRHILKQKYIHGLKNSQIAQNMGVTPRRVRQIHSEAVQAFEIPTLSKPLFRHLVKKYSNGI